MLSLIISALISQPVPQTAPQYIGVLAFDGVLTSDVTGPAEVFGMALSKPAAAGWKFVIVGAHKHDTITTAEGLRIKVDVTLATAPDLKVLILPGSYDPAKALALPGLAAFVAKHVKSAERVASHCAGAFLLASTGALDGKRATTYPGGAAMLKKHHPKVLAAEGPTVVVDGRFTTSNGSIVSYEGAVVLVAQLFGPALGKAVFSSVKLDKFIGWERIEAHL